MSKKYRQSIVSSFDRVCDGYVAMAKSCVGGLINIIFADLVPPFQEVFKSSGWKKGKPMRQIVDTIILVTDFEPIFIQRAQIPQNRLLE